MRRFVCFYCLTMIIIYYDLQKEKTYVLLHREFEHILNMQKYITHFVSTFHGLKMDVGFNLALFIFRPQLLRRFSEREKYKTGILARATFDAVSYTHLTLPTIYSV